MVATSVGVFRALVADPIAEEGPRILAAHQIETRIRPGLAAPDLIAALQGVQALIVRSETQVTAEVIAAAPDLQIIARAGVGVDNIDLDAATARGITVVNAPTGNIIAAAEHAIALLLALARNIPAADATLRAGTWDRRGFTGVEVRGKTIGIVGLGHVGAEVAKRAQGLMLRVLVHDPFITDELARSVGAELVPLRELLAASDFISLHVPLTETTRGLIGARELALCKPTARLINVARGGIVDEEALYEAVEAGRLAGAAVDVFAVEPARDSILARSQKIIVTPHLGASTEEAQISVAIDIADQIVAFATGQPLKYAVNAPLIAPEALSVLQPYVDLVEMLGRLATQLSEGQLQSASVEFTGEIAAYDTRPLRAALIKGLLSPISEELVNLVNANLIARKRGLSIVERKDESASDENYTNLVIVKVATSVGQTAVGGTVMHGGPHLVLVDGYWVHVAPPEGYFIFSNHRDQPGMIGKVGTLLGDCDINISSMQVGRLKPRGRAMMILGLDDALPPGVLDQIRSIPNLESAKLVRL